MLEVVLHLIHLDYLSNLVTYKLVLTGNQWELTKRVRESEYTSLLEHLLRVYTWAVPPLIVVAGGYLFTIVSFKMCTTAKCSKLVLKETITCFHQEAHCLLAGGGRLGCKTGLSISLPQSLPSTAVAAASTLETKATRISLVLPHDGAKLAKYSHQPIISLFTKLSLFTPFQLGKLSQSLFFV